MKVTTKSLDISPDTDMDIEDEFLKIRLEMESKKNMTE